jgi:hypothetical protein
MSSGDLLFIFSFIVLPTIILVSCIWALWLIRAGTLLSPRRVRPDAVTETPQEEQALEVEQPEQSVAEPVIVSPDVTTEQPIVTGDQVAMADPDAEDTAPVEQEAEPVTEMTTDLPIITQADIDAESEPAVEASDDIVAHIEPVVEQAAVVAEPNEDEPVVAPPPVAEDPDILLVPLDEDTSEEQESTQAMEVERELQDPGHSSNGSRPPRTKQQQSQSQRKSGPRETGNRRKPSRRVAQLRPTEDPEPRGTTLKRTGRGNRQ